MKPGTLGGLIGLLVTALFLLGLVWLGPAESAAGQGDFHRYSWALGTVLALLAGGVACGGSVLAFRLGAGTRPQRASAEAPPGRPAASMEQLLQAEKMAALGELVAGVAHEVNNPLTSIMGYTQLLLARDLPPVVRRRLETVCSEADRAGKIVRNLLTFARKHPSEKKYLGLNGIIEKTLELKTYHFRTSKIQVEKDLASDLPMTMLDYFQIQQVLLNLLNNAEQALEETGRGGRIRLVTRQLEDRIELRISDDGPGIRPEIQPRIFEPFFTTKKEGKGTGLGLPLCYGIVQEHGGMIRTEGAPGKGTTFIIELPVVQDPAAAMGALTDPPSATPTRKILVIDDEPSVQGLLVELLTSQGFGVDTAADVPEALRKIAMGGYDVIITDMMMPHGSGRDIYEAVAKTSPKLAGRVVFMTGSGTSDETRGYLREKGNPVILKPFRIEEIERGVAQALGAGTREGESAAPTKEEE